MKDWFVFFFIENLSSPGEREQHERDFLQRIQSRMRPIRI